MVVVGYENLIALTFLPDDGVQYLNLGITLLSEMFENYIGLFDSERINKYERHRLS